MPRTIQPRASHAAGLKSSKGQVDYSALQSSVVEKALDELTLETARKTFKQDGVSNLRTYLADVPEHKAEYLKSAIASMVEVRLVEDIRAEAGYPAKEKAHRPGRVKEHLEDCFPEWMSGYYADRACAQIEGIINRELAAAKETARPGTHIVLF